MQEEYYLNNCEASLRYMGGNKLVGSIIRDLRKQQNMTGSQLGHRAAMSQSKISKIENGTYSALQPQETERILNILNAPHSLRQKAYQAMETENPGAVRFKPYRLTYATDTYNNDRDSKLVCIFSPFLVPSLLQTNEYRLALLKSWGTTEDDMQILQAAAKRQDLLWDKQRKFHFIMHQVVLHSGVPGQRGLGLEQLDRIERFMSLPNIKIGIIPSDAGMPLIETGPFALLDRRMVILATIDGDFSFTDNHRITIYNQLFSELSHRALYGEEAKKLIKDTVL